MGLSSKATEVIYVYTFSQVADKARHHPDGFVASFHDPLQESGYLRHGELVHHSTFCQFDPVILSLNF